MEQGEQQPAPEIYQSPPVPSPLSGYALDPRHRFKRGCPSPNPHGRPKGGSGFTKEEMRELMKATDQFAAGLAKILAMSRWRRKRMVERIKQWQ